MSQVSVVCTRGLLSFTKLFYTNVYLKKIQVSDDEAEDETKETTDEDKKEDDGPKIEDVEDEEDKKEKKKKTIKV